MDLFSSPEVLTWIRSVAPLSILLIPHLVYSPPLKPVRKFISSYLSDLVPLSSLVSSEKPSSKEAAQIQRYEPGKWRQLALVIFGAVETGVWMGVFARELLEAVNHQQEVLYVVLSGLTVLAWLYLLVKPLLHPPSTPPWSALVSYILLMLVSIATLSSAAYIRTSTGQTPEWATTMRIILEIGNSVTCVILVTVIGTMRLTSPESYFAPDDDVTLFSWISFSWVTSFIHLGASQELAEDQIPNLSLTQQTAITFDRFRQLTGSTLLRKVVKANLMDLVLDAALTVVSVIFNYAGPFFLKRILDGISNPTKEAVAQAYIFAILAFLASILKAGSDLLHLWHSRRASVRIKNQLIAAIYDKALRRKDASGLITAKVDDTPGSEKKIEKKANADSGKVVNLMSGDTNRIANTVSGAYYIYGAPLEIVIAGIFLFNILGWSAFAGIIMIVIAVPLNSFISKRSVEITKDLLKARDGRISVMNELIGAIQFIKFFAWVEQWKARASEARAKEMKQMVRSIVNMVYFSLLWNITPIMVTLLSFFSYIVIEKRELTVSVAFTSISLFTMVRMPLNIIPTYVVILLQSHVAIKRIEDFLGENEVPDWVSSLKRASDKPPADYVTKIGFENATLCWNSGAQSERSPKPSITNPLVRIAPPSPGSSNDTTAVESSDTPPPQVFNLTDLNVSFPIGKLSVITGPTGSGKSAMLTALLGEMELLEGETFLPKYTKQVDAEGLRNSVAYCSQTPWLQQKSIKDNILFGEELDEMRYEQVLDACALTPDLDVLEDGDQTEIGAKGVSLSGGQKARVALARAVYSHTQHVLLDDPLAAVDSHTAKHLTDKCLNGPLLKNRTVIIVSHHVELLLSSSDYLVRILDGRIDAQGTPSELREAGELDGLVAMEEAEVEKDEPITADKAVDKEILALEGEGDQKKKKGPGKKLVQDEERAIGSVKWETYKLYILAATAITWVLSITLLIASQLITLGERWWLKVWGEAYNTSVQAMFAFVHPVLLDQSYHHSQPAHQHLLHMSDMFNATMSVSSPVSVTALASKFPSAVSNPLFYLYIYTALVLVDALLGVVASVVGSWSAYRACTTIHDKLLQTVMRATIRFFNVTPVGRIINRFSRDIETIDSSLNSSLRTVIAYFASLFGAVGMVAVIVPWFLIPACVISYIYYRLSALYLRTGRSLRRLEATSRSPIFSGFAELLDGVVSVRAFSVEKRFMAQLCEQVDKSQAANYYYWMLNRWLLLRFDVLGAVSVVLTTLLALSGAVSAGSAGMAILSAQGFVTACYWVSRFWGQLEMDFNAVERVEEYLHLAQEPPAVIANHRPPAYWPSGTSNTAFLSARDVEIKYAPDLPTVFKGSFEIQAGEKIGLIGRTGSGKSTLAMTMLRFTDPTSGSIWLDGIDITSIGVDDLRSRITYIPQDAVLFSGTVRENLDPFQEHSDQDLLDALARVNLGPSETPLPSRAQSSHRLAAIAQEDTRPSSPAGSGSNGKIAITLSTEVSAGGSNFSQGQRQLVAMARALLRRSNLIIMDEATASVDFETDTSIQEAIRSGFKSSCVITIAHRIASVIDYDRLLVLADGKVAEFDTPINLLRKDDSLFKGLCESSGKFKELYKAAEKKEAGSK